jgi:hypothetical protein
MKNWNLNNSWDEIIERFQELCSFELPFNKVIIKKCDDGYKLIEVYKKVEITFEISNFVSVYISFSNKFIHEDLDIIAACNNTNLKESAIYCLNKLEEYLDNKQYLEDKKKADKQLKWLISKK